MRATKKRKGTNCSAPAKKTKIFGAFADSSIRTEISKEYDESKFSSGDRQLKAAMQNATMLVVVFFMWGQMNTIDQLFSAPMRQKPNTQLHSQ